MIDTLFSLNLLGSAKAFFLSGLLGIFFGVVLEQAGFGSSRRLSGVFYFRDMAVIKVMFTAMLTAVIGLSLCFATGLISLDALYLNPTVLTPQIIGGLVFGVGFAMGGWCPGTAAVGAASGRLDAVIFLFGGILGSVLFNESFSLVSPLFPSDGGTTAFLYQDLGMGQDWFVLLFITAGILVFWGIEALERRQEAASPPAYGTEFVKKLSLAFLTAGLAAFIALQPTQSSPPAAPAGIDPGEFLQKIDTAMDHMEPEDLARRITSGQPGLILADVRSKEEFQRFHIRTARHIPLADLPQALSPYRAEGMIVLYSNGMTHPAQARDVLERMGFANVYILTDGLTGFIDRCLRPVSLRSAPVSAAAAEEIRGWQAFFLASESGPPPLPAAAKGPGILLPDQAVLLKEPATYIDFRSQPEYSSAHIPGSLALNVESLRGNVRGVGSCLLPAPLLAAHFSLMGIRPETRVILVHGDKVQDATLSAMALLRLGHTRFDILAGGFAGWSAQGGITDTALPQVEPAAYPAMDRDDFTVDFKTLAAHLKAGTALILDVRPHAYYTGEKSDEARAGHIPGAVNRPFDMDTRKEGNALVFKPEKELASAYAALIPSTSHRVIVHCRTGHQASQTLFVLRHILGYRQVLWYDAGWTEWAARRELPVRTGEAP